GLPARDGDRRPADLRVLHRAAARRAGGRADGPARSVCAGLEAAGAGERRGHGERVIARPAGERPPRGMLGGALMVTAVTVPNGSHRAAAPLECEFIIQEPRSEAGPFRILALTPAGPAEDRFKFSVPKAEIEAQLDRVRDDYPDLTVRQVFG